MGMSVSLSVHHFGPDSNISTAIGRIGKKFSGDIYVAQRMNHNDACETNSHQPQLHKCWHANKLNVRLLEL